MTSIFEAIESDDEEEVVRLLNDGVNVNFIAHWNGYAYQTPLHVAVRRQSYEIVKLLLEHGADVNRRTFGYLWSPFNLAISGRWDIIALLLDFGAKVDSCGEHQITALHRATTFGRSDVVEKLIQSGANVNAKDSDGKSALFRAAMTENYDLLKFLILKGAEINPVGYKVSPLHCAVKKKNREIVNMLLDRGADVNFQLESSKTALNYAVENDDVEFVCLLIEKGADLNVESLVYDNSDKVKLPLEYARVLNNQRCKSVLLAQLIKLKILGKVVNERNNVLMEKELKMLGTSWKEEEERMRGEKICNNSNVSLCNILVDSLDKVSHYFRNRKMRRNLKSLKLEDKFPLVSDLLKYRIDRGLKAAEGLERGEEVTRHILSNVFVLPDVCVKNICKFMGSCDFKLMDSFKR